MQHILKSIFYTILLAFKFVCIIFVFFFVRECDEVWNRMWMGYKMKQKRDKSSKQGYLIDYAN